MFISPMVSTVISTIVGIMVSVLTAFITHRLKKWDEDNARYRQEQKQKQDAEIARRQEEDRARDQLILGMARTMLLENYERCIDKGFYSVAEREVYHKLYQAYRRDHGNGVIEQLAEKIVELPTESPKLIKK